MSRVRRIRAMVLLVGAAGLAMGGCEVDSFLDPSVIGRWEMTPTTVPILTHLAVIEDGPTSFVEYSEVTPEDLLPEVTDYRIGPADAVEITIFGLFVQGQPHTEQRMVDARGYVDVTQIGPVYIAGMTRDQARQALERAAEPFVRDTVVSVVLMSRRQETYSLMGSIQGPGTFMIPEADFRLLDALALGGAFNEDADYIHVIRQVPLAPEATGRPTPPPRAEEHQDREPADRPTEPADSGEDLLRIIDELSRPPGGGSPGAFEASAANREVAPRRQPDRQPVVPLPGDATPSGQPGTPALDRRDGLTWVYVDGEWRQVRRQPGARPDGTGDAQSDAPLVTQRVIRVPVQPLIQGDARYNIVVRPGDVIRVPRPPFGNVFISGQIARPGTFQLANKLTLTRAVAAAGGLSGLGIPERVDLVRMVGDDRQAIVRLNLRAIEEGTQPDIYLKPNDRINIGTSFWALPLAVVRNGFRVSYGFGFLLDRNFGNDVFGPPPVRRQF